MRYRSALAPLTLAICLTVASLTGATGAGSNPRPLPPRPRILEAAQAPTAAAILRQVALTYAPQMSARARDIDFIQKVALAKRLLGVTRLVELRCQTLALLPPGQEISWEALRLRRWPGGDRVGVTLEAPVWVPARARRVRTYCGFAKKWQTVALTTPRPSGYSWFDPSLADINDTAHYRSGRIQFEINSKFAPLAGLLLEYIFREGWYDPAKRMPLMNVRGGEDTYAASAATGPVTAECPSFPDDDGGSLADTVAHCVYDNMAVIYHGRHAPGSNHRLGLAMDLNDFNYPGVVDGTPNPISRSLRQYDRDAMHKLDARQLPMWVYRAASWMGCRIPQTWTYWGYNTDWEHIDVGTK
jgi:hypothetical protein